MYAMICARLARRRSASFYLGRIWGRSTNRVKLSFMEEEEEEDSQFSANFDSICQIRRGRLICVCRGGGVCEGEGGREGEHL